MAASIASTVSSDCGAFADRLCEIEATCITGFEKIVAEDVQEKLGVEVVPARGKVFVSIPFKQVSKLIELYSLDNLYVVMKHYKDFTYADTKEAALEQLKGIVPELDWEFGLKVWGQFLSSENSVSHKPQESASVKNDSTIASDKKQENEAVSESANEKADEPTETATEANTDASSTSPVVAVPASPKQGNDGDSESSSPAAKKKVIDAPASPPTKTGPVPPVGKATHNPLMPSFRATCYRSGMSHCFQSPDVARNFGGAVQDYFGWNVKMKNYDIEVVVNIDNNDIYIALALTKESLHRRHIVEFGHCTLRPTIAYSMLRLCGVKSEEVICDPMCGTGTIPIEAAVNWPEAVHLAGDVQSTCVQKTKSNISSVNEKRLKINKPAISIDAKQWDATKLPFPDGHVDVFITDMPFGKRSGSKTNNASLYPQLLKEWARTSRTGTGRSCLLTQDRTSIKKTMAKVGHLWNIKSTHFINIGGIIAGVFLLSRTLSTDYKIDP